MIGLEGHQPDMTDYQEYVDLIESQMKRVSAEELEKMNAARKQASVTALKRDDFQRTNHVSLLSARTLPNTCAVTKGTTVMNGAAMVLGYPGDIVALCTLPLHCGSYFQAADPYQNPNFGALSHYRWSRYGSRLAEYGADDIKVTSPKLPDVPFFQVDVTLASTIWTSIYGVPKIVRSLRTSCNQLM